MPTKTPSYENPRDYFSQNKEKFEIKYEQTYKQHAQILADILTSISDEDYEALTQINDKMKMIINIYNNDEYLNDYEFKKLMKRKTKLLKSYIPGTTLYLAKQYPEFAKYQRKLLWTIINRSHENISKAIRLLQTLHHEKMKYKFDWRHICTGAERSLEWKDLKQIWITEKNLNLLTEQDIDNIETQMKLFYEENKDYVTSINYGLTNNLQELLSQSIESHSRTDK